MAGAEIIASGAVPKPEVLVVGAGPVGLMLAGELRMRGVDVLVVERLTAPTRQSRASTLHARTMEIFDQRGLLAGLGTPPHVPMGHFGGLPLSLGALPSRYAGQWKVPQTRTEQHLAAWATSLGAAVWRGVELDELHEGRDHVDVGLRDPGGAPLRVRARYIVGCDGEDSTVRRLAGIAFPGAEADRELLRADVSGIEVPDRRFERLPGGLAIAARRADGVTRLMVHEFGRRPAPRSAPPDFDEMAKAWARVTGEDVGAGTPLWVDAFGNAARQAAQYRRGRVLLAGDAAHAQMPVGGQALNLGLQDAFNLGWKLAACLRAGAGDDLLDTYHEERHRVGEQVLTGIAAQAMVLLGGPEIEPVRSVLAELLEIGAVRDRLGSRISGLDIRYRGCDGDHSLLGRPLPHTELTTEAGPSDTTALLRAGQPLLLDLAPGAFGHAELRIEAAAWADRVRIVTARPPACPALSDTDAVLVRPDGHVAWLDGSAAELRAALGRWLGPAAACSR